MNQDILFTAIVFFSIVTVIKMALAHKTKIKILDRGIEEKGLQNFFAAQFELYSLSSIKWGMVLVGIGLAALVSQLFPREFTDEAALGLIFIFAGLGFLIYYPIAERRLKQLKNKQNTLSN
ncbi:MAG: hypothetical protein PHU88_07175 [candidate division Zixibacteria bacterium]|nr:hypothetical protein [candidate division Zixibacteria bacterium]